MRASICLVLFFLFRSVGSSQSIEQLIEFQFNDETISSEDHIQIFDATSEYVVLVVRSNDFSTNSGFVFQEPNSEGALLFCTPSLDVIWSKSFTNGLIMDVIIGEESLYVYGAGILLEFLEDDLQASKTSTLLKIAFDGQIVWVKEYGGLTRFISKHSSLALDNEENLILATGLINYDHGFAVDSLFFNGDTCHCIAQDLDFPYCLSTLKWDQDGNELSVHVLNSISPSYATDVGTDDYGNYYVSATSDFSLEPPVFAGYEIDSGNFILKFGADNSEQWVYHRSDQLETNNSHSIYFVKGDQDQVYLDVTHTSNEIVTNGDIITLVPPWDGYVAYHTIHILSTETGELEEVDLFGYLDPFKHVGLTASGDIFQLSRANTEFEHIYSPYTYTPNENEFVLLSKSIQSSYAQPLILEANSLQFVDYIAHDKLYCDMNNFQNPISFSFEGQDYVTNTQNCIVIFDSVSNIEGTSKQSNEVTIFPNPVCDQTLHIQSPFPIHHVSVLNQQGIKVQSIQGFNKFTIDEKLKLSSGMYFLLVQGDDQKAIKRLIVQ